MAAFQAELSPEHFLENRSQKKHGCGSGVAVQEPVQPQQAGSSLQAHPLPVPFVPLGFAVLMDECC